MVAGTEVMFGAEGKGMIGQVPKWMMKLTKFAIRSFPFLGQGTDKELCCGFIRM